MVALALTEAGFLLDKVLVCEEVRASSLLAVVRSAQKLPRLNTSSCATHQLCFTCTLLQRQRLPQGSASI